ncbi:hypothetical protein [Clostridioides sp. ES-S-0006-03]
MNTKLDNREALSKIAEKLNESDMKQILAFLARSVAAPERGAHR